MSITDANNVNSMHEVHNEVVAVKKKNHSGDYFIDFILVNWGCKLVKMHNFCFLPGHL